MNRDEILRRFEGWLDTALAAEDPPAGIDAGLLNSIAAGEDEDVEAGRDTYALWSAMTTLAQEVKLQGRAFKELNDTLGGQPDRIADIMRAAARDRERELQRETERRCRKESLNVLIDLCDRMGRGHESVRHSAAELAQTSQSSSWLARRFSEPVLNQASSAVAALSKGYELAMERLDQALSDMNVRQISCVGEIFDPRCMNAIDREESAAIPEGTVLEVYRTGYEWNGEVFRTAQVKVSCTPKVENEHE